MIYNKWKILNELHKKTSVFNYRNIIECLALLENKKKVMRLVINDSVSKLIISSIEKLGLVAACSTLRLKTSYKTNLGDVYTKLANRDDPEANEFIIMVASDINIAKYAINIEDHGNDPSKLGVLLGYPECCVSAYEQISEQIDWLTVFLSNTPRRSVYPFGANRMAYLFGEKSLFFDYFPCGLTCEATCNLSRQMASVLEKYQLSDLLINIKSEMMTPILIRKGVIVFFRNAIYEADKQTLIYDLSKAGLHGWKVIPGADSDFVWDSNRLTRIGNSLFFYHNEKYQGQFEEEALNNRLFIFE